MIYLDSCALLKLIRQERETLALVGYVRERPETAWFTSELARTEIARALRRSNGGKGRALRDELSHASELCKRLDLIPVTSRLLTAAGELEQPHLRTLDAIHVASAASLRLSVTAFITYDKRLASAAQDAGLPVAAPGG